MHEIRHFRRIELFQCLAACGMTGMDVRGLIESTNVFQKIIFVQILIDLICK